MKKLLSIYIQPAFILCVLALAAASAGMKIVKSTKDIKRIKKELPLKASFDLLNEEAIAPYKPISKYTIKNKDILESLGTEQYLQWMVEDTNAPANSPTRYCSLFITYYTGNPDQVPHVPEECYTGGGSQKTKTIELVLRPDFSASNSIVNSMPKSIPARCLFFSKESPNAWQSNEIFPVIYLFKVNGLYRGNRTTTRLALMSNFKSEYSYFSKVEWKFFNNLPGATVYPTKEQAVLASEKLLAVILPVLEKNHWPDWEKINSN